jgi:hypothetical protein
MATRKSNIVLHEFALTVARPGLRRPLAETSPRQCLPAQDLKQPMFELELRQLKQELASWNTWKTGGRTDT